MNRIRELRDAYGMSAEELADRIGTSATQIRRLEAGARKLTTIWMDKIATALECAPADLIAHAVVSEDPDVEPAEVGLTGVATALARKGLHVYRVIGDGVVDAGINLDTIITVDQSGVAVSAADTGDIVLVAMGESQALVLRQYLRPNLVVTNRPGANLAIKTTDRSIKMQIVGVVVRG